jgi:hypothetical protein
MTVDHVQAMTDAVRKAGADLSTVADHLDRIDYLSPSEAASLTAALAFMAEQAQRARARVDAINTDAAHAAGREA